MKLKSKEEGYFRNFDLVIALINKESQQNKTHYSDKQIKYNI